jgi:hypothetical protein
MRRICRDCSRCTEPALKTLVMAPIRAIILVCGGFVIRAMVRRCPRCDHWLTAHRQVGGRFAD